MSKAFLPRFFRQRVFVGLIRAGAADPDLFGIEDEDAVIAERDFLGLPGGFVAVLGVLPVEATFIVISGDLDLLRNWIGTPQFLTLPH